MLLIVGFVILVFLSGFYASAETAFFTLRESQVLVMQKQGRPRANLVRKLKSNPRMLLITILVGNDVVNIFTASLATLFSIRLFGSFGVGIATGITTFVLLVFGDIIPKSYAQRHNKALAQSLAVPIYISQLLFWPITIFLIAIDNHIDSERSVQQITEDEIRAMSKLGLQMGSIHELENIFIQNIFAYHDVAVGSVMAPRRNIVFLDGERTVEEIEPVVGNSMYSRALVYLNNKSNIIGFVHANQILEAVFSDNDTVLVSKLARPIKHISEDEKMEHVITDMVAHHESIYLVHRRGKRGDIIGVVTLKDLLEKLIITKDVKISSS